MIELIFCTRFQVKNNHAFYLKEYITEQLKDTPGGTHIVLTGTGLKGTPLMAIGYRYSSKATLFFICTQDSGSTRAGVPYEMKFTDSYKNVCVRYVDRPEVIANYFKDSNIIDPLNHVRQFELALEKMVHARPLLSPPHDNEGHRHMSSLVPFKISLYI